MRVCFRIGDFQNDIVNTYTYEDSLSRFDAADAEQQLWTEQKLPICVLR